MKLYHNKDWLYQMYIKNNLSQRSIAKLCKVNQSSIHYYLRKFSIPCRKFCGRSGIYCSRWKGGRIKTSQGYINILNHNHPRANKNGYVPEQIIIAEKYLNRPLTKKETIHHINGIRNDNRIENLYLFKSEKEHHLYHFLKNSIPITKSNLLLKNG